MSVVANYDFTNGLPAGWTTPNGTFAWVAALGEGIDGGAALRSGDITDDETSSLEFTFTYPDPAYLKVVYKVDSEEGWDKFNLYSADGFVRTGAYGYRLLISGDTGWRTAVYQINPGSRTIQFSYAKDGSESVGADSVWIAQVQILDVLNEGIPEFADVVSDNSSTHPAQTGFGAEDDVYFIVTSLANASPEKNSGQFLYDNNGIITQTNLFSDFYSDSFSIDVIDECGYLKTHGYRVSPRSLSGADVYLYPLRIACGYYNWRAYHDNNNIGYSRCVIGLVDRDANPLTMTTNQMRYGIMAYGYEESFIVNGIVVASYDHGVYPNYQGTGLYVTTPYDVAIPIERDWSLAPISGREDNTGLFNESSSIRDVDTKNCDFVVYAGGSTAYFDQRFVGFAITKFTTEQTINARWRDFVRAVEVNS